MINPYLIYKRTANPDAIGKTSLPKPPEPVKPLYYISVVDDDSGASGVFIALAQIDLWEREGYISDRLQETDGDLIEEIFARHNIYVFFIDESGLEANISKEEAWKIIKEIPEIVYNEDFDKEMHQGAMQPWVHPYK